MDTRNNLLHFLAVTLFLLLWGVGTTTTDVSHSYNEVSLIQETVVMAAAKDTDEQREPVGSGGYQLA